MTFIEALGRELSDREMSRREMAAGSGVPTGTVNSWFSARASEPSVEAARTVAAWLGTSIDALIAKHEGVALAPKSALRKNLEALLDSLGDTELRVLIGTAKALVQESHAQELQSDSGS